MWIIGPTEHASDLYEDLLVEARKQDKNKLVLLTTSTTATVLVYDLAYISYQALHIGHIDLEYE